MSDRVRRGERQERYTRTRRPASGGVGSKALALVLGVAFVGAVGVAAFQVFRSTTDKDVVGTLMGYSIVDDSTMSIEFTVARDNPAAAAVCIIRARSQDGSETGRREVYIAPSPNVTVHVTAEVRTSQPPAVGALYGCGSEVPGYLQR
jgi:hypothetical protein